MPGGSSARKRRSNGRVTAYLGHVVSPVSGEEYVEHRHGALLVDESGKIVAVGDWSAIRALDGAYDRVVDYGRRLILPGFIDLHLHLPQITEVGQSGQSLLGWLESYIFPAEAKFQDKAHAARVSGWFFDELGRNGTTCAAVFTTIHAEATDIAFKTAAHRGNRVIMGKVMMDANCPEKLTEDTTRSLSQSEELCRTWHGYDNGRLSYAFTPRFAVTSTSALMEGVGRLWKKYPGSYSQTHLAENREEVALVAKQFPDSRSYLDVYERHGLVGANSIFAHSIHLDDLDVASLAKSRAAVAHCPSSNFFLKSGAFQYERLRQALVSFGLGSDVAAGPELSMLRVMRDAVYTQTADWLSAREMFYRATLASARALNMDRSIGSLATGKDADFIVVDPLKRSSVVQDIMDRPTDEILSRLVYVGDDRMVVATYVRGRAIYQAQEMTETAVNLPAEAASRLVKTLLSVAQECAEEPVGAESGE